MFVQICQLLPKFETYRFMDDDTLLSYACGVTLESELTVKKKNYTWLERRKENVCLFTPHQYSQSTFQRHPNKCEDRPRRGGGKGSKRKKNEKNEEKRFVFGSSQDIEKNTSHI